MQNPNVSVMSDTVFDSGTLTGTSYVQDMRGAPIPATATLKSADATRSIAFSTDGGIEYFTPVYDNISATSLIFVVNHPVTHIRFTGVANDTWSIR